MTGQRDRGGFSVAPQPLGGPPGGRRARRRALGIAVVGSVAAAILAIGWLGPRTAIRPPVDGSRLKTPTPTVSLVPLLGFGTPLPVLTGESGRFSGTVGVVSNGFRILDLATGETIAWRPMILSQDVTLPAAGGAGWVCLCMAGGSVQDVQLIRFDSLGQDFEHRTIGRLGTGSGPDRSTAIQTSVHFLDREKGLLAIAVEGPAGWTYSVASLDLGAGTLGRPLSLGVQRLDRLSSSPTPAPGPPDAFVFGPQVRIAPGGGRAFVWTALQGVGDDNMATTDAAGWQIRLDAHGEPTAAEPAPGLADPPSICLLGGFLDADRFAAICADAPDRIGPADVSGASSIRQIAADGTLSRRLDLPDIANFGTDMLFDRANGAIWVWNGPALRLRRIDAATGTVIVKTFDPAPDTASGGENLGPKVPDWIRPESLASGAAAIPYWGQMAGSPDGTRLYLLGYATQLASSGPQSLGIFVVDPRTMALLGRWDPDAAYLSIQMGRGGSVVMASGLSGVDEHGEASLWDTSVTFHDATDGRILARYGRLGEQSLATIIEP